MHVRVVKDLQKGCSVHGFESHCMHHFWSFRPMVRIPDFDSGDTGSSPVGTCWPNELNLSRLIVEHFASQLI